jgi:hypothetical protein
MATERFLRMTVVVDSVTQVLLQNVTVNFDTKKVPVELMSGLGGFTPGAKVVTISATSAVRISGPEFDAFESGASDTQHELQIPYGTKTIVSEGEIMSGSLSGSVNSATETSFEFMGTYNKPK